MKKKTFFLFLSWFFYFSSCPQGLRSIKPPIYFKNDFQVVLSILLLAMILGLIAGAIIFLLPKKEQKTAERIKTIKSAHQIAYEALEALRRKDLIAKGKIKAHYYELSDIIRRYLENRFSYRAPEMTTEEFLAVLSDSAYLDPNQKDILSEFLIHCDLVKFARYGPSQEEIENTYNCAKKLIDETRIITPVPEKADAGVNV